MTTQELRSYIDKTLGNNLRCLLPSFWWKKIFHNVIDTVEDTIENAVEDVAKDIRIDSNDIVFYLTEGAHSNEIEHNINSYNTFNKKISSNDTTFNIVILVNPTNDYFNNFGYYIVKSKEIRINPKGVSVLSDILGKKCDIHLLDTGELEIEVIDKDSLDCPNYSGEVDSDIYMYNYHKYINQHYYNSLYKSLNPFIIQALTSGSKDLEDQMKILLPASLSVSKEPTLINNGFLGSDTSFPVMFLGNSMVIDGTLMHSNSSNIRIISGNLFDGELKYGRYTNLGEVDTKNGLYEMMRSRLRSSNKIEVTPSSDYIFVSKTPNFWVNIYEYDNNSVFLRKQTVLVSELCFSEYTLSALYESNKFSVSENTSYIAFDTWFYSNTVKTLDIAIYEYSKRLPAVALNMQRLYNSYTTTLSGIGDVQDIAYGAFVVRRIGLRKYEEGDYDNENVLTDGKNTAYILDAPIYEATMGNPFSKLIGPIVGGTIVSDSEVPMDIRFAGEINAVGGDFYLGIQQATLVAEQGNFYKELANKTYVDSAINSSIKEVLNTEI